MLGGRKRGGWGGRECVGQRVRVCVCEVYSIGEYLRYARMGWLRLVGSFKV